MARNAAEDGQQEDREIGGLSEKGCKIITQNQERLVVNTLRINYFIGGIYF